MSEEEGELFFQINKVPDEDSKGSRVFVKSDGTRFTDGRTLKLEVNTPYVIHIEVGQRSRTLTTLFVNSIPLTLLDVGENIKSNSNVYKAIFDTNTVRLTQDSERDTLIICAHLEGVGALMVPIQTKYYSKELSKKVRMGIPLDSILVQYRSGTSRNGAKSFQLKKAVLQTVSRQQNEKQNLPSRHPEKNLGL